MIELLHRAPPSALAFMVPALVRGNRHRRGEPARFPPLRLRWEGFRLRAGDVEALRQLTGLPDDARLELLALHVAGFRPLMRMLTHASFPLPIWRTLQVRNRIALHRRLRGGAQVLACRVAAQRTLEKGVEVDLASVLEEDGEVAWESASTFYYRGTFPAEGGAPADVPRPPEVPAGEERTWTAPRGIGLSVARLTGDYNPLHYASRYARRLGFEGTFLHPQVPLGQCLARLPAPPAGRPLRLDTWVRGQVYDGAGVRMVAVADGDATLFALRAGSEERPALVGRLAPE